MADTEPVNCTEELTRSARKRSGRGKRRDSIRGAPKEIIPTSPVKNQLVMALSEESLASGSGTPGTPTYRPKQVEVTFDLEASTTFGSEESLATGSCTPGTPSRKPKQLEVSFEIEASTTFGSEVRVVGSLPVLGSWKPEAGITLLTSPVTYPLWSTRAYIPCVPGAEHIEYKFVVVAPDGRVLWEDGPNRVVRICLQARDVVSDMSLDGFRGIHTVGTPNHSTLDLPVAPHAAKGDTMTWHVTCTDTKPGDRLFVVGASPALGAWKPLDGLELVTTAEGFPTWHGSLETAHTVWKVVLVRKDGSFWWEDGPDRGMEVPSSLGVAREWLITVRFRGGPAIITEVVCIKPPPGESLGARTTLKALSPPTSVGSGVPRDESDGISTFASDSEEREEDEEAEEAIENKLIVDDSIVEVVDSEEEAEEEVPEDVESSGLRLNTGAHQVQKSGGRCEDAYFCAPKALGVADGVGQMLHFSKYGVDSAAYALGLMDNAHSALRPGSEVAKISDVEERAAAALKFAEEEVESYGASTICVLCVEGTTAGIANLGDSGVMVLRKKEDGGRMDIVFKTDEQQHGWNFPYQLMRIPQALASKVPKSRRFDSADDCERYSFELMPGDLVLLYSDGLADNLHQHEILDIVNRHVSAEESPAAGSAASAEAVAEDLCLVARERSVDDDAEVPFNVIALEYGHVFNGGKADDITVVAAWVTDS